MDVTNLIPGETRLYHRTSGQTLVFAEVTPRGHIRATNAAGRTRTYQPYELMTLEAWHALQAAVVPVERRCVACGRDVSDTTEITGKDALRHRTMQGKHGFARGRDIVHYTQAQADANARKERRMMQWWNLDKRMRQSYPTLSWLVTLAASYFEEGNYAAGADALHSFRREVRNLEAARELARIDWLDASDSGRWAA